MPFSTFAAPQEEIFGPVMSILKFNSTEEVITRANASFYGLAGAGALLLLMMMSLFHLSLGAGN